MDLESMYKSSGEPWTNYDDEQLDFLYNKKNLNVIEISNLNNRTPGTIISRLIKYKYINTRQSARGYLIYKNSELYKEIVSKNRYNKSDKLEKPKKEKEKTNKTNENYLITINRNDYFDLKYDVDIMKNDIKEIKNTLNELVEMMKAVYEFEDA
jgi:hypothetical protein